MTVAFAGVFLPASSLTLGVILGTTYGLLAVGLVIVFRSSRILNLAHAAVGVLSAALMVLAISEWHFPYVVAFPLAIGAGAVIGAGCEAIVVRRLRTAPAIMSIVATLGLGAFLNQLGAAVNSSRPASAVFPEPPWLPRFTIGGFVVGRADTAMLVLTPLAVAALALFFTRTRTGLGIRAAAANPEAAEMAGLSPARLSCISWGIAGALSAYTVILILPTLPAASTGIFGSDIIFRALAAAVIARMVSLPFAFLAGTLIGVVDQVGIANFHGGGGPIDLILLGLVVVALLLQRSQTGRGHEKGSWALVQAWPALPEVLRRTRLHRGLTVAGLALGVAVAALSVNLVTNSVAMELTAVCAFSIVGLSLGVLTGLSGQLSLGQFALGGFGAAAAYVVVSHTHNFVLGFPVAALASGLLSVVLGVPALRIRGLLLAVVTLGFSLAAGSWLFSQSWMFNGGVRFGTPTAFGLYLDTSRRYYGLCLIVLAIALVFCRNIRRGGLGRRMRAVRDNEDTARAFGISAVRTKLLAFFLAGTLAGLGGAVLAMSLFIVNATSYPQSANIDVVAMAALGGLGTLGGPVLGAAYIVGLPLFFPLDNAELAATSLGWLLLILYFPGGLAQLLRPARDRYERLLERHTKGPVPAGAAGDARVVVSERTDRVRPEVVLRAAGLTKAYAGVHAVSDVSFELNRDETLGIIGPNGAGKTTLFEMLSGFATPNAGSVRLGDLDVTRMSPTRRARNGLIRSAQDAALFPTLTVSEVIMLAQEREHPTRAVSALLGLAGRDRVKRARADEIIDLMGLGDYREKEVRTLSTGVRRIVDLSAVLVLQPSVLLLDEPASGVAQRETEALGDLLRMIRRELGLSMIVIEHDIPLIMGIADRMIAMETGRILAVGTPEQIRNEPRVIESYLGADLAVIERSDGYVAAGQ